MRYKVGDRVRITTDKSKSYMWNSDMEKWCGKVMTIRTVSVGYYEMEEDYDEHGGGGWLWYEDMIDGLVDERKIVITTDGKITKAILYNGKKLEKTVTAKCSPEDEFDFKTGAEIAFNRLFEEKENGFTGEAVCMREDLGFTKGRIYDFENGYCLDDDYDKRPVGRAFLASELESNGFIAIKE